LKDPNALCNLAAFRDIAELTTLLPSHLCSKSLLSARRTFSDFEVSRWFVDMQTSDINIIININCSTSDCNKKHMLKSPDEEDNRFGNNKLRMDFKDVSTD
jgi:hypothetical protein